MTLKSRQSFPRNLIGRAFRSTVIFGGVGMGPQVTRLRQGVDIVIATPGRLLDHAGERTVDLSQIEILVLDEADRMLDMGFINDIRRVLALLPKRRQNLLFSATYSPAIQKLADSLLHDPEVVEVARRNTAAETVTQVVHPVAKADKRSLLTGLIREGNWHQVLVFTRTKHGANRLADHLGREGITAAAIHGNKSQGARTRALANFKSGEIRVLVATDVASRGLDISRLPHVVNYELPNVPEDYVHRIGRTGRAGEEGCACSLVSADERAYLRDIERLLKRDLPVREIPGYAMNESDRAEKPESRGGGRSGGGQGQGRGQNPRQKQKQDGEDRPRGQWKRKRKRKDGGAGEGGGAQGGAKPDAGRSGGRGASGDAGGSRPPRRSSSRRRRSVGRS